MIKSTLIRLGFSYNQMNGSNDSNFLKDRNINKTDFSMFIFPQCLQNIFSKKTAKG